MNDLIRASLLSVLLMLSACSGKDDSVKKAAPEPDLEQASALNVQLALGYIQREQLGVAAEKLDKAIEQDPSNVDAYTSMAYLKSVIGEDEDAVHNTSGSCLPLAFCISR